MNEKRSRGITETTARLAAFLVTMGVVILDARWLIVGQEFVGASERGSLEPPIAAVTYQSYPSALVYAVAVILLVVGLARLQWLAAAWIGLVLLIVWSALFLFSSGAAILPAGAALLVLLTIIQTHGFVLAWIELLLLLFASVLLNYPLAVALLLATGVLLLILTMINWLPRIGRKPELS